MPRFRFCVKAPDGRIRRGTVNESELSAAQARLLNAGFEILELSVHSELLIETPKSSHGGRGAHRVQRATIIEFEETPLEKLQAFLERWVLRREAALALLVLGVMIIAGGAILSPSPPSIPQAEYRAHHLVIKARVGDFDGSRLRVNLPEIPYSVTEIVPVSLDDGWQTVEIELESLREPSKVEVRLLKFDGAVIAEGSGPLLLDPENRLNSRLELEAVTSPAADF